MIDSRTLKKNFYKKVFINQNSLENVRQTIHNTNKLRKWNPVIPQKRNQNLTLDYSKSGSSTFRFISKLENI